ncbi:MAG: TauD/TfdA family dioxygenase, partial [Thermoanaerobaculia bacterium]
MKKLPLTRRRSVDLSSAELVRCEPLVAGRSLPLLLRPGDSGGGVDPVSWAAEHSDFLEQRLLEHGGLLFRGFDIDTPERFESFIRAAAGDLLDYQDRATPRSRVHHQIYTSTDYPADQTIELHNENCYASSFPMKLFFCCQTAARNGGETPLADCRQVYD